MLQELVKAGLAGKTGGGNGEVGYNCFDVQALSYCLFCCLLQL